MINLMNIDNEEEVTYEEVPEPHVIETGDSVKVKQVLDDATMEAIRQYGYESNYFSENLKIFLMFLSCAFAMTAQFYPIPFPKSRPLLGLCCAAYFILSSVLQFIVTFIDKETIMITKPHKVIGQASR
jgi:signal peptidase complex subunit 2